jgi:excisionase family DNA binding protein
MPTEVNPMASIVLKDAAAALGVAASTLRWQIHNGKLRGTKIGPMWTVTHREVERYRRENLQRREPT